MSYRSWVNRDKRVPPAVDQLFVLGDPDQRALKETGDGLGSKHNPGELLDLNPI